MKAIKSAHSKSNFVSDVFDRNVKSIHRTAASQYKDTPPFRAMFDLPLISMMSRLKAVRKEFKNIAFIGPNPYMFLQNHPYDNIESFTFIENS
jgi:hypothetical protein